MRTLPCGRRRLVRSVCLLAWLALTGAGLGGCVKEEELLSDNQSGPIGNDGEPPPQALAIDVPPDIRTEATAPATAVDLGEAQATGGEGSYGFTNNAPGTGFPLGVSVVTWTVTDGSGTQASGAQQVTIDDTTPPSLDEPADILTFASGERTPLTLDAPSASDLADPAPRVTSDMPADGFPMGNTEIIWTATDASGNATSVNQVITIVAGEPGGPLTIEAPADRQLEATGPMTLFDPGTATVGGGMPPLAVTKDVPANGFPLGTTTLTWTVTDSEGQSVSDNQAVTVIDSTAPALVAPGAVTRRQGSEGGPTIVDLGTATASDAVDAAPVIANDAPASGFPVGTTIVRWTATDASGNSATAAQSVTVTGFSAEYCEDLVPVFATDIYPRLDKTEPLACNGCHTGSAPLETPNGFAFPNAPPGAEDFEVFRAVAAIDVGNSSLVLVKARGGENHTGGDRYPDGNADPDFVALDDFVNRARGCIDKPEGGTEKVILGTPYEQLHRITAVLAARPPSDDEIAAIAGAADQASLVTRLGPIIDGLLNEDAFYERVVEIYGDLLLTNQYATSDRDINFNFGLDAFSARTYFETNFSGNERRALRQDANYGFARAPVELIRYILATDRPFSEILTADYTMVNPYTAVVYGVNAGDPSFPFSSDRVRANHDRNDFRRVNRIVQTAGSGSVVPMAGVIGTHGFLSRYPSTATNLNRKRARFTLMLFLGSDIEALAPRDALDLDNEVGAIPTYQDPQCTVCHDVMDPVAGLFTKRSNTGDYDINRVYEWTRTRFGVQRMVPAGFGNTRVNASAQLPDAYLDRPLQWFAAQMVADDRFAVQTARVALHGLTGIEGNSSRTTQFVNQLKATFVGSGFDYKALVKAIVTSEFFLARDLAATESPSAYADLGPGRLLTPEELDRKITAWLGTNYHWAGPATGSGLRGMHYLPYGGLDGDEITSRTTSPTALIDGIQERIASQVACERVARDLYNGGALFPDVSAGDTPDTAGGREAIRDNIRFLHRYLLGEDLAGNDPEIESTYRLFVDARALGETTIPAECRGGGAATDSNRTILPWMAVVTYLLADFRFVYD